MTAPHRHRHGRHRAARVAVAVAAVTVTLGACSSMTGGANTSSSTITSVSTGPSAPPAPPTSSIATIATSATTTSGVGPTPGSGSMGSAAPTAVDSPIIASKTGRSTARTATDAPIIAGSTSRSPARTATDGAIIATTTSVHSAPITGVTVTGTIATGLTTPWGLAFLPDGTALVTERDTGKILAISSDAGHPVRTVGTVRGVVPGGEGGLLGIAVDPMLGAGLKVFVYYTAAEDNRVAVLDVTDNPPRIIRQRDIVTGIPKASVHNGGRLAIGPDGDLYIATGDATDSEGAQRLDYLGGKILRVTLDGKPAPGNPFPKAPLVYSYGHRNVQGLAFDARGRLWASEFGANSYDELNLIKPGGNYGWPVVEGPSDDPRFVAPYRYWPTSEASPSGLAIVGETAFMAALRGTRLWMVPLTGASGPTTPKALLDGRYGRLRTVVVAPDGDLWLTTSNTDGRGDPQPGDDRILQLNVD